MPATEQRVIGNVPGDIRRQLVAPGLQLTLSRHEVAAVFTFPLVVVGVSPCLAPTIDVSHVNCLLPGHCSSCIHGKAVLTFFKMK